MAADNNNEITLRARKKFVDKLHSEFYPEENEEKEIAPPKPESKFSFQNICWVLAAIIVYYTTDFRSIALYDPRVNRTWFNIGVVLITLNISICLFLIIYVSYIKKIHSDLWEKHYPSSIPIATAAFAFGSFCLAIGMWPIWGIITPVLLFTMFMGIVVTIAAIPDF